VAVGVPGNGSDLVRVRFALSSDPVGVAGSTRKLQVDLTGRPTGSEQSLMRLDRGYGERVARAHEARRDDALAQLAPAAAAASASQRPLMRAIEGEHGRIVEADPLSNTLVAVVPQRAIAGLARRSDVRAVQATEKEAPLVASGLGLTTAAVGAPSFWGVGYAGGGGSGDRSATDLAIISDKIQQDHPAFAGIDFQTPAGRGVSSTVDHGAAVASLAISRGASGCGTCVADDADRKGVAPDLDTVLDAAPLGGNAYAWALGVTQPLDTDGNVLVGAADPAEVMSDSHGAEATEDDSISAQNLDGYTSTYGTTIARPAGNEGPARTVNTGCMSYNTLCMGAFDYWGTEDPSDDRIPDFSSRGPTPAGRKKPDLVAVGVTMYADRRWAEPGRGLWSGATQGTSFASPQGAGAAALLAGSGLTDPNMQKAVLINSARQGAARPPRPWARRPPGSRTGAGAPSTSMPPFRSALMA
jgi:hypothetical protein